MSVLNKEIFISYDEQKALCNNLNVLLNNNCDGDDFLLSSAGIFSNVIKTSLREDNIIKIMNFTNEIENVSMIIRGLPIDLSIPATPYDDKLSMQNIRLIVAINLGLYRMLNIFPITYQGENNGRLFRNVAPNIGKYGEKSSHGSQCSLGMHVDNSYLPLSYEQLKRELSACPEYLSLFGIRCNLDVSTKISFLDNALEILDDETKEQLKQSNFLFKTPDSFEDAKSFRLPVLVQYDDVVYFRFDSDFTLPLTNGAKDAFDKLNEALLSQKTIKSFLLQPGDFLIFKNQRVSHARNSFNPRYDGTDRWLIRLFGVSDLNMTIPVDKHVPYHVVA